MRRYSVSYRLYRDGVELYFPSEKAAGEYLGVAKCTVASCYRRHSKCKGYTVERGDYTTHHATKTRLYKIWDGMRDRCQRATHKYYKNYGGRGISVCDEWQDFMAFSQWALDNGYEDTLTLDRIDNNSNYEPKNCRWATMKQQAVNKRNNHLVTVNNETMTLSECSRKYGIPKSTIRWREAHNCSIITGAKID